MFGTRRSADGGMLLVGFGVVLAAWLAVAGAMMKSYYEGGAGVTQCQVVCNEQPAGPAHG